MCFRLFVPQSNEKLGSVFEKTHKSLVFIWAEKFNQMEESKRKLQRNFAQARYVA
jgi:hypothetical protein